MSSSTPIDFFLTQTNLTNQPPPFPPFLPPTSIIFFDEIDGLAPVRSSRQDQIHASIVSTLLALMDGVDARGQIIVIGATNRIDAIDPALRRPGRFDRELLFTLPSRPARRRILDIHTALWTPPLQEAFKDVVAARTAGYCGADIKALCTEAALRALRRTFPEIYESADKLVIDPAEVVVEQQDFLEAMGAITPASHRANASHARPLGPATAPILRPALVAARERILAAVPPLASPSASTFPSQYWETLAASSALGIFRPRLLLAGPPGNGQAELLFALMHSFEGFPVFSLDFATLAADPSYRTPAEGLSHVFAQAQKVLPAVLVLPHASLWWETASYAMRATLTALLRDLPAGLPLLLLSTAAVPAEELPADLAALIGADSHALDLGWPDEGLRSAFLADGFKEAIAVPPSAGTEARARKRLRAGRKKRVLAVAPPPEPKAMPDAALEELEQVEAHALRELRRCLRAVVMELRKVRRFKPFFGPVDPEEVPDYYEIIANPLCLDEVEARIDAGDYSTVDAFLADIDLIVFNAFEYNPANDPDRVRKRARDMEDTAKSLVARFDPDHRAVLDEIARR